MFFKHHPEFVNWQIMIIVFAPAQRLPREIVAKVAELTRAISTPVAMKLVKRPRNMYESDNPNHVNNKELTITVSPNVTFVAPYYAVGNDLVFYTNTKPCRAIYKSGVTAIDYINGVETPEYNSSVCTGDMLYRIDSITGNAKYTCKKCSASKYRCFKCGIRADKLLSPVTCVTCKRVYCNACHYGHDAIKRKFPLGSDARRFCKDIQECIICLNKPTI
jgi:hypothetical protein